MESLWKWAVPKYDVPKSGRYIENKITLRSDNLSENSTDIFGQLKIFHNFKSQAVFQWFCRDQEFDSTRKRQTNIFVMSGGLRLDFYEDTWFGDEFHILTKVSIYNGFKVILSRLTFAYL